MTDEELLAKAVKFELRSHDRRGSRALYVSRRTNVNDTPIWAIECDGECLNHDGDWEYEPRPSSRTEEFFGRCRWYDLHEAIAFAEAHMAKQP